MEGSCIVDAFSKATSKGIFYTMCFVWVHFIWTDVNKNRLLLILLNQHRMKMTAIVPEHLIHLYNDMEFVGGVFVLNCFQIENFSYHKYPKHEGYFLICGNLKINIPRWFHLYPLVPTIKSLMHDRKPEKYIIATSFVVDVVGKIIIVV
ncbi:hypothetical protein R6Q57_004427 [Mikania cordata]